jgi:hypothetical protein
MQGEGVIRDALGIVFAGSSHSRIMSMSSTLRIAYVAASDSVCHALLHGVPEVDTQQTVAALVTFILAMLLHPESQAKARAEIDAAVGRDRVPTFADRPNLPYVDALLMEALRWQPVTPQGIPHAAEQDVLYNGYCIPKGAILICNAWYVCVCIRSVRQSCLSMSTNQGNSSRSRSLP